MAYVLQDQDEDQVVQGQQAIAAPGTQVIGEQTTQPSQQDQPQVTGGQGGTISGTGGQQGSSAQPAQQTRQPSSTGFINIQRYIDQNRPQSMQLAERVGGEIDTEGQEAQQAIGQAEQTFVQQAESQVVQPNQEVIDQAASEQFTGFEDPQQTEQFTQAFNAPEYSGPESLVSTPDYTSALQEIGDVATIRNMINSPEGRKELLGRIQDTQRATQGVMTLDTALLGVNPDAQSALTQRAEQYSDLDQLLAEANERAITTGQNVSQQNLELQGQLRDQFLGEEGVIPTFTDELQMNEAALNQWEQEAAQVQQQNQQLANQQAALNNLLTRKYVNLESQPWQSGDDPIRTYYIGDQSFREPHFQPSASELSAAGITKAQWDAMTQPYAGNTDGNQIVNQYSNTYQPMAMPEQPSVQITDEDRARLQALAELSGLDYDSLLREITGQI